MSDTASFLLRQADDTFTFAIADAVPVGAVDRTHSIVRGVSMITGSLEAKGHDLQVDDTTLKQIFECAKKLGKVPVKLDHGSGILNVNGHLAGFTREGNKVRANWQLLESHPNTAQMLEIAEKQPETVGLSVTFRGAPENKGGKKYARCTELVTCDLVPHPAANPDGMFAASVDSQRQRMPDSAAAPASAATPAAPEGDALQQILAELKEIRADMAANDQFNEKVHNALFADEGGQGEETQEEMAARGGDPIVMLERRLETHIKNVLQSDRDAQVELAEEQETRNMITSLSDKLASLTSQLEDKDVQITALSELNKQLRAGNGLRPTGSTGSDTTMFGHKPESELHSFEKKVRENITALSAKNADWKPQKVRAQATQQAINENPTLFDEYRKRQGSSIE